MFKLSITRCSLFIRYQLAFALLIGIFAGSISYYLLFSDRRIAHDFTWPWIGAQDLLQGQNPYITAFSDRHPWHAALFYPLPALLLSIPTVPFPAPLAGAVFMGISSALLAFAICRKGKFHLLLIFISAPFLMALRVGQWSPLMVAISLLPVVWSGLLICKPNLGVAIFAYRPDLRTIIASVINLAGSLLLMPERPFWWFKSAISSVDSHLSPLRTFPGLIILLAIFFGDNQKEDCYY